jgi:hypothetical protein
VGWGLVSADGWRVPYRGSDCVIYHEGCGHTVGLPHPEPGNGSVMSMGQYRGWLSESWLDKDQKERLAWKPREPAVDPRIDLFSRFRALQQPAVPGPGQPVVLALQWPEDAAVDSLRVRFQTSIEAPWIEVPQAWTGDAPATATLGVFDRPTPVSYRVDAALKDGTMSELWGYFQVRSDPQRPPQPRALSPDLIVCQAVPEAARVTATLPTEERDLLELADPATCWTAGEWALDAGKLLSPKRYGARLQLPYSPPAEYRLTLIVEPLDDPNGLILGQRSDGHRFVTLFNYAVGEGCLSAIEDIDGRNVGNETTFSGKLFEKDRLSQAIVTVRNNSVTMSVDGRTVVNWQGEPRRLSLADYWRTPDEQALFIGAYDCRYRFHRMTIEPLSGKGRLLGGEEPRTSEP